MSVRLELLATLVMVGAGAGTAGVTAVARKLLTRHGVVATPNDRTLHLGAVPRGSGLAFVIVLSPVVALLAEESATRILVAGAILYGVLGLADDLTGLSSRPRLAILGLLAVPASLWSVASTALGPWTWPAGVLAGLWFTAFVNAFNFMDGINGIAMATTIITGAHMAVCAALWDVVDLGRLGWVLIACAAGFLPFNFPVARVFLGDVGSYFLGAMLAGGTVLGIRGGVPPEVMIAPLLYYLSDTGVTLLRRAWRREAVLSAHREHAFQKLVTSGLSHPTVTGMCSALMALTAGAMLAVGQSSGTSRAAVFVAASAANLGAPLLAVRLRARDEIGAAT